GLEAEERRFDGEEDGEEGARVSPIVAGVRLSPGERPPGLSPPAPPLPGEVVAKAARRLHRRVAERREERKGRVVRGGIGALEGVELGRLVEPRALRGGGYGQRPEPEPEREPEVPVRSGSGAGLGTGTTHRRPRFATESAAASPLWSPLCGGRRPEQPVS